MPGPDGKPLYDTSLAGFAGNARKRATYAAIQQRVAELRAPGIAAAARKIASEVEEHVVEVATNEKVVAVTVEALIDRLWRIVEARVGPFLTEVDPQDPHARRYFDTSKLEQLAAVAEVTQEEIAGPEGTLRKIKVKPHDPVQAIALLHKIMSGVSDPVANASLGDRLDKAIARERQLVLVSPVPASSSPPPPAFAPSTPPADPPSDASPAPTDPPDPPKPNDPDAPPDSIDELVRRRIAAGGYVAGGFDWMRKA